MSIVGQPDDSAPDNFALVESVQHLRIVSELAVALLPPSKLHEILWLVARTAISKLGFEDCVIYLLDERRAMLLQKAAYGPKNPVAEEILDPIEIPIGQGIVGAVAASGRSDLVNDTRLDSRYILDDAMRLSELAVPIIHGGEVIGVIDSEHPQAGFYTEAHRQIMTTVASMASTKIASALTIERLNTTVAQLEATEIALRQGERRYRMLYDHHPSMFFTLDRAGTILSANTFALEQLGYTAETLVGQPLVQFSPPEDAGSLAEGIARCVAAPGEIHRWESCRLKRDGTHIWVRETAHEVELSTAQGPTILVVSEDITDTYNLARELKYQASHDALTGLFNRREFEQRVHQALENAQTEASEHALCYLDLDQFKVINDTAGHAAGDELLRQLAVAFKERIRKSDVIARLGGDEFGVLVSHCSIDQAARIAESLLEVVGASRFHWEGRLFRYGVSIGVVPITGSGEDLSGVLAAADAACYVAKEAGRNRIHVYSSDDKELLKRHGEMRWAVRLNEALERDGFELYYQPIRAISGEEQESLSIEVQLRMVTEDGLAVAPKTFFAAAERYGMSTELDRWVIHQTLEWLVSHAADVQHIELCSINLSRSSLNDAQFADYVATEIQRAGVAPNRICFEITETAAIANLPNAKAFIHALKSLGCLIALDDFGSGLSSFAYLKNLPVDFIKIGGTFVRDLIDDPVDRAMVRSISDIVRMMGKRTVAEFVESEAILLALRAIGVDYAQGDHIGVSKPLAHLLETVPG